MKLTILGSGTCVPSLKRAAPGYYLSLFDKHILIDCGSGSLLQLEKADKSYQSIDTVFITHTHPDHISDLIPLIQALFFTPDFTRSKKLLVVGPQGLKRYYHACIPSLMKVPDTFPIEIIEIEDRLTFKNFSVFATKTLHSENSIAYRFEAGGKSLVITGDCDYDQHLISFSQKTNLLIADCSFPDSLKTRGHLTSQEAGLIAKKARVQKLILSHIYPSVYPDEDRVKECRNVYDGKIILAADLMEIEIR